MSVVTFWGSSDDLIEVEGTVKGCDEYDGEHATFVVIGKAGGKTIVKVDYTGTWAVSIAPFDEDMPMVECKVQAHPNGYSAAAVFANVDSVIHMAGEND